MRLRNNLNGHNKKYVCVPDPRNKMLCMHAKEERGGVSYSLYSSTVQLHDLLLRDLLPLSSGIVCEMPQSGKYHRMYYIGVWDGLHKYRVLIAYYVPVACKLTRLVTGLMREA